MKFWLSPKRSAIIDFLVLTDENNSFSRIAQEA